MEGVEYEKIPKGRGFLYVHDNQLYQRVKTNNDHKCYLLTLSHCDRAMAQLSACYFSNSSWY